MVRHTTVALSCLLAGLVAGLIASEAHAQDAPPTFTLTWIAPAGCPDARAIEAEILRLAGHPPAEPLEVRATLTQLDVARWRIEIVTSSATGEGARTIEGATCASIAEAGALVVAMAIDPEAASRTSPPEPEPEPETAPTPALAPTPARAPTPTPAPAPAPVSFLTSARATLGAGPLPAPSAGAELAIGLRVDPMEIWAGASFLAPQGARNARGAGSTFAHVGAHLRGCVPLAIGDVVELAPCLGVERGSIWTTDGDVPGPALGGAALWLAIAAGADARVWLARELAISLFGSLGVPVFDDEFFVYDGATRATLHDPGVVAFHGGLGLVLRVP